MVKESMPKDARVMTAILRDMGVNDYEPRVVNQLLEFSYRYICSVLEDSKVISQHAKKKNIDADDVKLAVELWTRQNFTSPPSRDVLLETARTKNSVTLPVPKPSSGGMKLPPDRHCITACNYRLKSKVKPKGYAGGFSKMPYVKKQTVTLAEPTISMNPKFPASNTPVFKIQVAPGVQLGNSTTPVVNTDNKRKREDDE